MTVVEGSVFGGGWGLLGCSDVVIAVNEPSIRYQLSEVKLGMSPVTIMPFLLNRIPKRTGRRLALLATPIKGEEAKKIGLIDILIDRSEIEIMLEKIAKEATLTAPNAVALTKEMVRLSCSETPGEDSSLDRTAACLAKLQATEEVEKGVSALIRKEKPEWAKKAISFQKSSF